MSKLAKALTAAAGNAGESLYVEDVFSTYLYTGGLSSPNVIQTNIDLAGEGGLVWTKNRTSATSNQLTDTVSGYRIESDDTAAGEASQSNVLFNSDGHSLSGYSSFFNGGGDNYASWTFRKAEKFFDVVTYTGTGAAQTIAHSLGSTPAVIIVKRTSGEDNWVVYHSSIGATKYLILNLTGAAVTDSVWNNTSPTATEFSLDNSGIVNQSGSTFVAYLFASDAGGFGDDGSESIIKCGSYTGNGSTTGPEIDLGFEPQWLMVKRTDGASNWSMKDIMRGFISSPSSVDSPTLYADSTAADGESANKLKPLATGFQPCINHSSVNTSGGNYIYIAIRRPMKTPESGTEVFSPVTFTGDGVSGRVIDAGFSVDTSFGLSRSTTFDNSVLDRIRGNDKFLYTVQTGAEATKARWAFDEQNGIRATTIGADGNNNGDSRIHYFFKRATGFFDVVAYTGTGVASALTVNHNLAVNPELIIIKSRDTAGYSWMVGTEFTPTTFTAMFLQDTSGNIGYAGYGVIGHPFASQPTASSFEVGTSSNVNASATYIAYLFATLAGVSKVGSYTGTGSNIDVDCGFSAGARFILIKRTDSTGDWYVWDSARGIVAGNDPYLLFNSDAIEVTSTDYIDPLSSGFTVTSTAPAALNASGGTYIFLAIA